jgi:dihydroorotate dehydrogenase electron transfer subunit
MDYTDLLPITQIKAKIISQRKIGQRYFKMSLVAPRIAKVAKPGQFINIKVSDNYEPLLRRPFSIHRVGGSNIEILYEIVGLGTQILSQRKRGEYLDILGPLGNGFSYHLPLTNYQMSILVAGGIGVAPLLFLAQKIKTDHPKFNIQVLIGAKTKEQLLCEKEFKTLGYTVKISTDDGSKGFRGKVTDLLKEVLRTTNDERQTTIYACGPRPMLKEISKITKIYKIPAQVSLEEHMVCGIGACLGCAVNTKEGYKRVCKDGPVFNAEEIIW